MFTIFKKECICIGKSTVQSVTATFQQLTQFLPSNWALACLCGPVSNSVEELFVLSLITLSFKYVFEISYKCINK